jgi:hypothetical protein
VGIVCGGGVFMVMQLRQAGARDGDLRVTGRLNVCGTGVWGPCL